MEHPQLLHPCLDFGKYLSSHEPGVLSLWNCFSKIGYISIRERVYLTELKKFLTSEQGKQVTHFNFEKNFDSLALNNEKDFDLFIDMLAENNGIKILEIGNNYVPNNLIEKLVKVLADKNLDELNLRIHWPGYMQNNQNLPFITCLIKYPHRRIRARLLCKKCAAVFLNNLFFHNPKIKSTYRNKTSKSLRIVYTYTRVWKK